VGEQIGKGRKLKVILKQMKMVAEGIATTKSAFDLSVKLGIDLPITRKVYDILFRDVSAHAAMFDLMTRKLKVESEIRDYMLT
jgi:glycerol-3-phosphate dehydrogenase (NAD(P)+)